MFRRISVWDVAIFALFMVCMMLAVDPVHAATGATQGGGSGLPMEIYVQKIVQSFTGPIAYGFVVLMFMGAGIKWWQSDFGAVGIGFLTMGCIGAIVVAASQFVSILYSGAVI